MLLNISSYYFSFVLFITYNNLYYLLKKRITAIANIMQKEVGVINKTLNVISHSKPYFYNIIEFEEQLIPTIKSFELKMYSSKKEWNSIISYLYQDHKDLLLCVL